MINILINLLMINIMITYIWQISGFIDEIKRLVWKILWKNNIPYKNFDFKPFTCSICMTFWISILYILIMNNFSLFYIFMCIINSYLNPIIYNILIGIKEFLIRITNKIK